MDQTRTPRWIWIAVLAVGMTAVGCGDDKGSNSSDSDTEFVAALEDLSGYEDWERIDYTIDDTNPAAGSAHAATLREYSRIVYRNASAKAQGSAYPRGSIIVKETFTWENGTRKFAATGGLLAMVKRGGDFNPEGNGWEWIALAPDRSGIAGRGGAEMMNGNCNACHSSAQSKDFVFPHPIEYATTDGDFADFREWTLIEESTGPSNLLGAAHKPDLVRRIYKKQILASPDPETREYPTGTILLKEVLDGSEVVEITAMVKRGGSFNEGNDGWEWFMLDPATGNVAARGDNLMDGMCSGCHSKALNSADGVDYVFKHPDDPFNR